jgi:hypothetical protein
VLVSRVYCSVEGVGLRPPFGGVLPDMEEWYAIAAYELPPEVNGTSVWAFVRFFEEYGDHIVTRCDRVGGLLSQMVAVDNEFITERSLDGTIEEAVKVMQVDMGMNATVDPAFMKSAIVEPLRAIGGAY